MAYTTELRDTVWVITSDGTVGGFTYGDGTPDDTTFVGTIRWLPAAGTDTITLAAIKEDGTTTMVVWEDEADGTTQGRESELKALRLQRGFNIVMSNGARAYLYTAMAGLGM